MKRGTFDHPKMMQIASRLGIPRYAAGGLLEALWHWTGRFAPQGDVGRWANSMIAQGCYWDGDPNELIAALVEAGWLDECQENRLVVHDWDDHADQTTKKALQRRGLACVRKVSGQCPDNVHKNNACLTPDSCLQTPEPDARRDAGLRPDTPVDRRSVVVEVIQAHGATSERAIAEALDANPAITPIEVALLATIAETKARKAKQDAGGLLVRMIRDGDRPPELTPELVSSLANSGVIVAIDSHVVNGAKVKHNGQGVRIGDTRIATNRLTPQALRTQWET